MLYGVRRNRRERGRYLKQTSRDVFFAAEIEDAERRRGLASAMSAVDDEGFPAGADERCRRHRVPVKDEESGEVLREKVVALRRQQDHLQASSPSLLHSSSSWKTLHTQFPLVREHQRFGGFRIQDALRACGGDLKLRRKSLLYRRGLQDLVSPGFQTCVYLEGGVPVRRVIRPTKDIIPDCVYGRRQIFRVPKESLPPEQREKTKRSPKTICVSIWEEFLYGKSVLNHSIKTGDEIPGATDSLYKYLGRYLSKSAIDILMYTIFFLLYFASCCIYNMFWELGSYILFSSHLQIHQRAYDNKIDVEFTGSSFQGPAYVFVRNWCAHCVQRDREKIMFRLMKKMKADIIANKER
ncbi:uncharacterized protein [Panulirus ornatus]|uniref:uncharacterized protein isoform X2 n=1 Tax=Panulirus ornatus TaxID=150431 RepID=UPI003A87461E